MQHNVDEAYEVLLPLLKKKRLVLFAGSGISVDSPSGLPKWDDMMLQYIDICRRVENLLPADKRDLKILKHAEKQVANYPHRVASVLKQRLQEIQKEDPTLSIDKKFISFFTNMFAGHKPNEYHRTIVQTNYPFILTTNYDTLLEDAASATGFQRLGLRSYGFANADLVASALYENNPAIVHAHGVLTDVALDNVVFTARDYAAIKRKYPGFTLALQSIFLRYSVLFVGYGGSDPHMEDFVEELSYLLDWSTLPGLPSYFLTLKSNRVEPILAKHKESLRTQLVLLDDYPDLLKLLKRLCKDAPRPKETAK